MNFFKKKKVEAPKHVELPQGVEIKETKSKSWLDGFSNIKGYSVNAVGDTGKVRSINGNSFVPFSPNRQQQQSIDVLDQLNEMMDYPAYISYQQLEWLYQRNPIANRVCNTFPESCWNPSPVVLEYDNTSNVPETEFEKACQQIADKVSLWEYMKRADIASQKGQYGVLYIAFDDANSSQNAPVKAPLEKMENAKWKEGMKNPSTQQKIEAPPQYSTSLGPVDWDSIKGKGADAILMVVPYEQPNAWPTMFAVNYAAPGFSLISYYNLQSGGSVFGSGSNTNIVYGANLPVTWNVVHSSRCVHMVDHNIGNNLLGIPLLYPVFNSIVNMIRVTGGSSMAYQLNARGGLSITIDVKDGQSPTDQDMIAFRTQVDGYLSGYNRVLMNQNMKVQPINHTMASPDKEYDTYLKDVAAGVNIPSTVIIGHETGRLAAEQDSLAFSKAITQRREGKCAQWIKQFFDPLIAHEVIPKPKNGTYRIYWPNLDIPDDATQALNFQQVAAGLASLAAAPSGDIENKMADFTDKACTILGVGGDNIELNAPTQSYLNPDTRSEDMVEVFGENDEIGSL